MAKIKVYNLKGKEVEEIDLSDNVFGLPKNDELVHQVFVSIASNQRQVLAHTKNRGDRAGSGIKPWKQKGTGRARVGSVRNPAWKKGGVAFGPRNDRNFTKKVNKKMNYKAIATVLSGKVRDEELIIVDKLELAEKKTKEMAKIIANLKIDKKAMIAFSKEERDLIKYSQNIKNINNILINQLNVSEMLSSKYLLMSKESIKVVEDKYKEKVKGEK